MVVLMQAQDPDEYAVDIKFSGEVSTFSRFLELKKSDLFQCLISIDGDSEDDFARSLNADIKMFREAGIFSKILNQRLSNPKDYWFEDYQKAQKFSTILNELDNLRAEVVSN